jgi:transcriptional regulator with XRE-family HTH domain
MSLEDFAEILGCSPSTLSHWMNDRRRPGPEYIKRLEELFGPEVYDALEIERPDPILRYIETNWEHLEPIQQKAIHEEVKKYLGNQKNEISSTTP